MSAERLTDQTEKFEANGDYLIHVVDPNDQTDNAAGSSFKMKLGLLGAGGGGTLDIMNTPVSNPADTNKNILYAYDVPANTLSKNGDVLEIEGSFVRGDAANPSFTAFIDTPNFTTGQSVSTSTRFGFILRIIRISETTYTRYAFYQGATHLPESVVTHNTACDFTTTFTINFAIQNVGNTAGSSLEFTRITLIKAVLNGVIPNTATIYTVKKTLTAAQIKTGFSVPIEALAAPGAGYAWEPIGGSANYTYGTIVFNGGGGPTIWIASETAAENTMESAANFMGAAFSVFGKLIPIQGAQQLEENKKLMIYMSDDSTTGDGTVDIYIDYIKRAV